MAYFKRVAPIQAELKVTSIKVNLSTGKYPSSIHQLICYTYLDTSAFTERSPFLTGESI